MKILHITTAWPRSESDVITPWLVKTVRLLRAAGEDIRVLTSSYRGLGNQTIAGVPVYRFRYFLRRWENLTHEETAVDRVRKGLGHKLLAVSYLLCGTLAAWKLSRRERFDVIHVHWPLPHALLGWSAERACRAPTVISFYGAELRAARPWILRRFLRRAIRKAAAVTAISNHTAAAVREILGRPVAIIPYGATTRGPSDSEPARREPGPGPTRQLLFVGRLVERKGVAFLVEATGILKREMPVHLNIVGTGPEEPGLKELVRERGLERQVTFHGFVSSEALAGQYRNCDVFILPAVLDAKGDTEGLGVVIIEALNCRKPVVASALGGIVDIVIPGRTGLLTRPGDPEALAAAIRQVLTDPVLARRLGEDGYRHVNENFSWPAIIARLETVYRRLAAPDG